MADFIVDEDDENGAPLRWCSSYILEPQTVSSSVFFSFITNNHLILYICNLDLLTVWCRRRKLKKKSPGKHLVFHQLLCRRHMKFLVMLMSSFSFARENWILMSGVRRD